MKYNAIALCGLSESGKDTFANLYKLAMYYQEYPENENLDNLKEQIDNISHFSNIPSIAFADNLKKMYSIFSGVPLSELYQDKVKEKHRDNLIAFADKLLEINPLFPIEGVQRKIIGKTHYVITDVRMPNEVKFIKQLGIPLIKIIKSDISIKNNHITETNIDKIEADITIYNDGTLIDLYKTIQENL